MDCREAESHVVDIEISKSCILPVDNLHNTSLFFIPSFIDNEKIASCKNKFFCSLQGSLIIFFWRLLSEACTFAYANVILETGACCFIETGELLAQVVIF